MTAVRRLAERSSARSSVRRARSPWARPTQLAPGALVGGRFRLDRQIAKGGFGEVWVGEHCATGMRVALKMLLPETATNPEIVQRFKREGLLLGRVRSDRVARVIDFLFDPK